MSEQIAKVLQMVEDGKINASEGMELIQTIKEEDEGLEKSSVYTKKSVRIKVLTDDVVKVNLTVPLKLVQLFLKLGRGIASSIPEAQKYLQDEDFDTISEAIEQQIEGNIIDLETEEGERVLIAIE